MNIGTEWMELMGIIWSVSKKQMQIETLHLYS